MERGKFRFRSQQENYPRIGNVKLARTWRVSSFSSPLDRPLSRLRTYGGFVLCRAFCAVAFKHISERGRDCTFRFLGLLSGHTRYFNSRRLAATYSRMADAWISQFYSLHDINSAITFVSVHS